MIEIPAIFTDSDRWEPCNPSPSPKYHYYYNNKRTKIIEYDENHCQTILDPDTLNPRRIFGSITWLQVRYVPINGNISISPPIITNWTHELLDYHIISL